MSEQPENQAKSIHTGGGSVVEGSVETGGGDFVGRDKVTISTVINNLFRGDSEDVRKLRNRQVMLKLVYDIWVKGVLEKSLYNQLLIDLDMEQRPEAVERPWGMVLETPAQDSRLLPANTKIATVFAELNQSMLILGDPGSGKSTMLLELARDLLAQAGQNPTLPMPVLFNLSSWAEKRQPIGKWLVDELREKYQIPKALAQTWVAQDELLLLLDGLDEVKPSYREECIQSLNEFQQICKIRVPLVLCSRIAEYEALTGKLKLNGAIVLRSLAPQQIDTFLLRAGDKLSTVVYLLQHDVELKTLAQSPLTFSILCLTYQDKAVADVKPTNSVGTRRQQLFDAYIVRMFQRPGKLIVDEYPRIQTLRWLVWLAAQMMEYAQTEFLIERLQPNWMQSSREKKAPVRLIMFIWGPLYGLVGGLMGGLISSLIFGLLGGLIGGLKEGLSDGLSRWLLYTLVADQFFTILFRLSGGLTDGLVSGLLFGMSSGLGLGLISGFSSGVVDWVTGGLGRIRSSEQSNESWKRLRSSLFAGLFWWLIFVLFFGLLFGLIGGLTFGLTSGLTTGLLWGLSGGLVAGFKPVKLVDQVSPSKQLRSKLSYGWRFGLIVGVFNGLLAWLFSSVSSNLLGGVSRLSFGAVSGLFSGLLSGLLIGLICGLSFGLIFEPDTSSGRLTTIMTQEPNQGIKRVGIFSFMIGLIFWLVFWLISGLNLGLSNGLMSGLSFGPLYGLMGGLIGGLVSGGDIFVKHLVLRFALYFKRYTPLNYAHFLDYCADRIFLRKVGGGYIFVHRLLMEHFASLTEEDIKRLAAASDRR